MDFREIAIYHLDIMIFRYRYSLDIPILEYTELIWDTWAIYRLDIGYVVPKSSGNVSERTWVCFLTVSDALSPTKRPETVISDLGAEQAKMIF